MVDGAIYFRYSKMSFCFLKDISFICEEMEEQRGAVGGAKMAENRKGTGEGNKTTRS